MFALFPILAVQQSHVEYQIKSMTITAQIRKMALKLLSARPDGMRYSELNNRFLTERKSKITMKQLSKDCILKEIKYDAKQDRSY